MTAAYFYDRNWDKKKKERKRVVITGIGSVTPIGHSLNETWSNLIKGISGIAPITIFDASRFPVKIGAECLPPGAQLLVFGDGLHALPTLERRLGDTGEPSPRRKPTEIPITYPKQWESTFTIDADAPLGPAFWRLHCAQGGTGSRPLVVGDLPEFIETESNSQPHLAEPVSLPVTVNGQIHESRCRASRIPGYYKYHHDHRGDAGSRDPASNGKLWRLEPSCECSRYRARP